jgi:hypothetical protein
MRSLPKSSLCLLVLLGLKSVASAQTINPNGNFFTNFANSTYETPLLTGNSNGAKGADLNATYSVMYYATNPAYELIVVGEFPSARYFSLTVNDDQLAVSAWIKDYQFVPLTISTINPYKPNTTYIPNQFYAAEIGFGGTQPVTVAAGCSLNGYNVHGNFIDASVRNTAVGWVLEPDMPSTFPAYQNTGPNMGGSITFRRYLSGPELGYSHLSNPSVIVRRLSDGSAVPASQVAALNLISTNELWVAPYLQQTKLQNLTWYYETYLPQWFYPADPTNAVQWVGPPAYLKAENPDAGYLGGTLSATAMQAVAQGQNFVRFRFRLPKMAQIAGGNTTATLTGTEQLRYWSLSFMSPSGTLLSISDAQLHPDPNGNVTLIVGPKAECPAYVSPLNYYTFIDTTSIASISTATTLAIRTILPASTFLGSVNSVPYRTSEYNPLGGFMGPYVPLVDLVVPSSLPSNPAPPSEPESEGLTPPANPPPVPTVATGNYVIPSGPSIPGYGGTNP